MNGYYALIVKLLREHGYQYARQAKGSHEVWEKHDASGNRIGRVQVPVHLDDKRFANKILKGSGIKDRIR